MNTPSSVVEQLNNVVAVVQMFPDVLSAGVNVHTDGHVQVQEKYLDIIHQIIKLDALKITPHTAAGSHTLIHKAPTKAFPTVTIVWVTAA